MVELVLRLVNAVIFMPGLGFSFYSLYFGHVRLIVALDMIDHPWLIEMIEQKNITISETLALTHNFALFFWGGGGGGVTGSQSPAISLN